MAEQPSKTLRQIVRHADLLLDSGDEVLHLTRDEWRMVKGELSALDRLREACREDHGGSNHEPECPICDALRIETTAPGGSQNPTTTEHER